MTQAIGITPTTAAQIRSAMFGVAVDGLRVERQAWRISDRDSDELVLLCVRATSWWVARRTSDRLAVWAYAGDDEAWEGFDRLMADGEAWHEVSAPVAG